MLAPRAGNTNRARKLFDIFLAQRNEIISELRFNLSLQRMTLDRTSQNEVDEYNRYYNNYTNALRPSKPIQVNKEELFSNWKDIFAKGIIAVQAVDENELSPAITNAIRPKNMSKKL
jgi:hypothetical protein